MKVWTIMLMAVMAIVVTGIAWAADEKPTYAERLGWPKGSRVVIFHVDDAGMSHDSNVGAIESIEKGVATSTSLMMPCPWVSEFYKHMLKNPGMDVGIHVTLTSEWGNYRWAPVAGKSAVPGLVDKEGCLWEDVPDVVTNSNADEVEKEIRAQLDRAETMGIKPTHLDSHMGTVFFLPFFERYMKVGIEKHIPIMVPGGHLFYVAQTNPELSGVAQELGEKVWEGGLPVLDDLHTGGFESKKYPTKTAQVIDFLHKLKPGVTQFIVHSTRPSEIFQFISGSGGTRLAELEALTDPEVKKVIEDEKIILTTWRELQERRDKVK